MPKLSRTDSRARGLACAAEFRGNPHLARDAAASPAVRAVVTTIAVMVERAARRRAPVDTGRLRNSITHRVRSGRYGPVAEVGTNLDYAAPQEFGTVHMAGKRYLGGALQEVAATLRRRSR